MMTYAGFEQAFAIYQKRGRKAVSKTEKRDQTNFARAIRVGFYDDQIAVADFLFRKKQIKIVILEHRNADTLNEIAEFIGAERFSFNVSEKYTHRSGSSPSSMSSNTACELAKMYEPHNENLFSRIGYRIPEWLSPAGACK